ncbi:GNAT family N-acetyltransferase [Planktotalea sp.]|uniref:GNAT family N-acetyltransferase n=1 Tax=Planktotalea sp. TaxID=2029877 RepID=UPI003297B374
MELLKPQLDLLPEYIDALKQGWSPDNLRAEAAQEQLIKIEADPHAFVSSLDDPLAKAGPVILPDGSQVERLPSIRRWIWDRGFCGHISLRWQKGTEALPVTCSGHIGYSVLTARRGEGLATAALKAILPEAKAQGLRYVEITASPENPASIRVIEKADGVLLKTYIAEPALGGHETCLFRISLS